METPTAHDHSPHDHPNHDRAYWGVFVALGIFTVVELGIPSVLGGNRLLMILALMTVAGLKAGLVGAFYMHLKYEKRMLVWMAVSPLILVFVLIHSIGTDVSAVNQGGWTITPATEATREAAH